MKTSPPEEFLLAQDDLVARVLLEHVGTAFAPPDPRRTTNYLDLSKIGEEGETPASDEIWLAVEDGEEEIDKGFLTSSDEEEDEREILEDGGRRGGGGGGGGGVEVRSLPSTVETDKLSTAATMAGHVASRRNGGGGGSGGINGGGDGGEDRDLLLEDLDEEAVRNEEVYVGVTARLQGVLSEELLPIQDTLAVTEKSVVVLADKLQRMEGILQSLAEKVGGEGGGGASATAATTTATTATFSRKGKKKIEEGKSIEGILRRIEELSTELSSVTTAKKLQEDNDTLRTDLDRFRQREKHLLSRIEVMERAMITSKSQGGAAAGSSSSSSRPSSRRSSIDATATGPPASQELPPIAKPREKKGGGVPVAATREKIEVGRAIQMLAKEEAAAKRPRLRRGSLSDGSTASSDSSSKLGGTSGIPAAANAISSDCLHTEIQIARSDNAILRQDLQVFRERESQLVKRNKELEDKLLLKRTSSSSSKKGKVVESSKSAPEAQEPPPSTANLVSEDEKSRRKAELDINIDFTLPGKAVIREKGAVAKESGGGAKEKEEKKAAVPPPRQKSDEKGDKHKATPDEKAKKEVPKIKKPLQQNGTKAKPKPKVAEPPPPPPPPPAAEESSPKQEPPKVTEEDGGDVKTAIFDSEEWRVTVSSTHELDISSESPKTVVVTQSKPAPPPPPPEEPQIEEPEVVEEKAATPPPPPPPKPKAQVVQPKPKPKPPKKSSPPAAKVAGPPPPPPPPPPPKVLDDPRSDPIPKPPQYPVARPPRDYKPGKALLQKKKRTSVEDIIRQDSVGSDNKVPNGLVPRQKQEPPAVAAAFDPGQQQRHSNSSSNNVIQMLVKEDVREVGLSDVPPSALCQVLK